MRLSPRPKRSSSDGSDSQTQHTADESSGSAVEPAEQTRTVSTRYLTWLWSGVVVAAFLLFLFLLLASWLISKEDKVCNSARVAYAAVADSHDAVEGAESALLDATIRFDQIDADGYVVYTLYGAAENASDQAADAKAAALRTYQQACR